MSWFLSNWEGVSVSALLVLRAADFIVKHTKTTKDDEVVDFLMNGVKAIVGKPKKSNK